MLEAVFRLDPIGDGGLPSRDLTGRLNFWLSQWLQQTGPGDFAVFRRMQVLEGDAFPMQKFYLFDPSLESIGGHHFDYALQVGTAAEELGFEVVLATHRRFRDALGIPATWHRVAAFRYTTYTRHTDLVGSSDTSGFSNKPRLRRGLRRLREDVRKPLDRLGGVLGWNGRRARVKAFANGLSRVFRLFRPQLRDFLFVPTLSDLDLIGLVEHFHGRPSSCTLNWNLQFHYELFDADELRSGQWRQKLALHSQMFQRMLQSSPPGRLSLYTTTEQLAEQYNAMNVGRFQPLCYPISRRFLDHRAVDCEGPLRITCPGAIRAEKGQAELADLLGSADEFSTGRWKLRVQSNKSWFQLPDPMSAPNVATSPEATGVEYTAHPLSPNEYADFILASDVGLLLYDRHRYIARRAGVLGEFLTAGVPVLVTAGCWLSDQLDQPNRDYLQELAGQLEPLRRESFAGSPGTHRSGVHPDRDRLEAGTIYLQRVWQFPNRADSLMVGLNAEEPLRGGYFRIVLRYFDCDGCERACHHYFVRPRNERTLPAWDRIPDLATRCEVTVSTAFTVQEPVNLSGHVTFYRGGADRPLGAVGLTAVDRRDAPRLLRDLDRYRLHYRTTAKRFSESWFSAHDPRKTVSQLLQRSPRHSNFLHPSVA